MLCCLTYCLSCKQFRLTSYYYNALSLKYREVQFRCREIPLQGFAYLNSSLCPIATVNAYQSRRLQDCTYYIIFINPYLRVLLLELLECCAMTRDVIDYTLCIITFQKRADTVLFCFRVPINHIWIYIYIPHVCILERLNGIHIYYCLYCS